MKLRLLVPCLVIIVIAGCSKSSDPGSASNPTTTTTVTCTGTKTFSSDVSPIIQSVCATAGCHNAGSTNGPGPLTTYQQVFDARTLIRSAVLSGLMPKSGTLTASEKSAIICWIDAGATNN